MSVRNNMNEGGQSDGAVEEDHHILSAERIMFDELVRNSSDSYRHYISRRVAAMAANNNNNNNSYAKSASNNLIPPPSARNNNKNGGVLMSARGNNTNADSNAIAAAESAQYVVLEPLSAGTVDQVEDALMVPEEGQGGAAAHHNGEGGGVDTSGGGGGGLSPTTSVLALDVGQFEANTFVNPPTTAKKNTQGTLTSSPTAAANKKTINSTTPTSILLDTYKWYSDQLHNQHHASSQPQEKGPRVPLSEAQMVFRQLCHVGAKLANLTAATTTANSAAGGGINASNNKTKEDMEAFRKALNEGEDDGGNIRDEDADTSTIGSAAAATVVAATATVNENNQNGDDDDDDPEEDELYPLERFQLNNAVQAMRCNPYASRDGVLVRSERALSEVATARAMAIVRKCVDSVGTSTSQFGDQVIFSNTTSRNRKRRAMAAEEAMKKLAAERRAAAKKKGTAAGGDVSSPTSPQPQPIPPIPPIIADDETEENATVVPISSNSCIDLSEPALVHVWRSAHDGQRFQLSVQTITDGLSQHLLSVGTFVSVVSVAVRFQGRFVTVTWVPPLASAQPIISTFTAPTPTALPPSVSDEAAAANTAATKNANNNSSSSVPPPPPPPMLSSAVLQLLYGRGGIAPEKQANALQTYAGKDGRYYLIPTTVGAFLPDDFTDRDAKRREERGAKRSAAAAAAKAARKDGGGEEDEDDDDDGEPPIIVIDAATAAQAAEQAAAKQKRKEAKLAAAAAMHRTPSGLIRHSRPPRPELFLRDESTHNTNAAAADGNTSRNASIAASPVASPRSGRGGSSKSPVPAAAAASSGGGGGTGLGSSGEGTPVDGGVPSSAPSKPPKTGRSSSTSKSAAAAAAAAPSSSSPRGSGSAGDANAPLSSSAAAPAPIGPDTVGPAAAIKRLVAITKDAKFSYKRAATIDAVPEALHATGINLCNMRDVIVDDAAWDTVFTELIAAVAKHKKDVPIKSLRPKLKERFDASRRDVRDLLYIHILGRSVKSLLESTMNAAVCLTRRTHTTTGDGESGGGYATTTSSITTTAASVNPQQTLIAKIVSANMIIDPFLADFSEANQTTVTPTQRQEREDVAHTLREVMDAKYSVPVGEINVPEISMKIRLTAADLACRKLNLIFDPESRRAMSFDNTPRIVSVTSANPPLQVKKSERFEERMAVVKARLKRGANTKDFVDKILLIQTSVVTLGVVARMMLASHNGNGNNATETEAAAAAAEKERASIIKVLQKVIDIGIDAAEGGGAMTTTASMAASSRRAAAAIAQQQKYNVPALSIPLLMSAFGTCVALNYFEGVTMVLATVVNRLDKLFVVGHSATTDGMGEPSTTTAPSSASSPAAISLESIANIDPLIFAARVPPCDRSLIAACLSELLRGFTLSSFASEQQQQQSATTQKTTTAPTTMVCSGGVKRLVATCLARRILNLLSFSLPAAVLTASTNNNMNNSIGLSGSTPRTGRGGGGGAYYDEIAEDNAAVVGNKRRLSTTGSLTRGGGGGAVVNSRPGTATSRFIAPLVPAVVNTMALDVVIAACTDLIKNPYLYADTNDNGGEHNNNLSSGDQSPFDSDSSTTGAIAAAAPPAQQTPAGPYAASLRRISDDDLITIHTIIRDSPHISKIQRQDFIYAVKPTSTMDTLNSALQQILAHFAQQKGGGGGGNSGSGGEGTSTKSSYEYSSSSSPTAALVSDIVAKMRAENAKSIIEDAKREEEEKKRRQRASTAAAAVSGGVAPSTVSAAVGVGVAMLPPLRRPPSALPSAGTTILPDEATLYAKLGTMAAIQQYTRLQRSFVMLAASILSRRELRHVIGGTEVEGSNENESNKDSTKKRLKKRRPLTDPDEDEHDVHLYAKNGCFLFMWESREAAEQALQHYTNEWYYATHGPHDPLPDAEEPMTLRYPPLADEANARRHAGRVKGGNRVATGSRSAAHNASSRAADVDEAAMEAVLSQNGSFAASGTIDRKSFARLLSNENLKRSLTASNSNTNGGGDGGDGLVGATTMVFNNAIGGGVDADDTLTDVGALRPMGTIANFDRLLKEFNEQRELFIGNNGDGDDGNYDDDEEGDSHDDFSSGRPGKGPRGGARRSAAAPPIDPFRAMTLYTLSIIRTATTTTKEDGKVVGKEKAVSTLKEVTVSLWRPHLVADALDGAGVDEYAAMDRAMAVNDDKKTNRNLPSNSNNNKVAAKKDGSSSLSLSPSRPPLANSSVSKAKQQQGTVSNAPADASPTRVATNVDDGHLIALSPKRLRGLGDTSAMLSPTRAAAAAGDDGLVDDSATITSPSPADDAVVGGDSHTAALLPDPLLDEEAFINFVYNDNFAAMAPLSTLLSPVRGGGGKNQQQHQHENSNHHHDYDLSLADERQTRHGYVHDSDWASYLLRPTEAFTATALARSDLSRPTATAIEAKKTAFAIRTFVEDLATLIDSEFDQRVVEELKVSRPEAMGPPSAGDEELILYSTVLLKLHKAFGQKMRVEHRWNGHFVFKNSMDLSTYYYGTTHNAADMGGNTAHNSSAEDAAPAAPPLPSLIPYVSAEEILSSIGNHNNNMSAAMDFNVDDRNQQQQQLLDTNSIVLSSPLRFIRPLMVSRDGVDADAALVKEEDEKKKLSMLMLLTTEGAAAAKWTTPSSGRSCSSKTATVLPGTFYQHSFLLESVALERTLSDTYAKELSDRLSIEHAFITGIVAAVERAERTVLTSDAKLSRAKAMVASESHNNKYTQSVDADEQLLMAAEERKREKSLQFAALGKKKSEEGEVVDSSNCIIGDRDEKKAQIVHPATSDFVLPTMQLTQQELKDREEKSNTSNAKEKMMKSSSSSQHSSPAISSTSAAAPSLPPITNSSRNISVAGTEASSSSAAPAVAAPQTTKASTSFISTASSRLPAINNKSSPASVAPAASNITVIGLNDPLRNKTTLLPALPTSSLNGNGKKAATTTVKKGASPYTPLTPTEANGGASNDNDGATAAASSSTKEKKEEKDDEEVVYSPSKPQYITDAEKAALRRIEKGKARHLFPDTDRDERLELSLVGAVTARVVRVVTEQEEEKEQQQNENGGRRGAEWECLPVAPPSAAEIDENNTVELSLVGAVTERVAVAHQVDQQHQTMANVEDGEGWECLPIAPPPPATADHPSEINDEESDRKSAATTADTDRMPHDTTTSNNRNGLLSISGIPMRATAGIVLPPVVLNARQAPKPAASYFVDRSTATTTTTAVNTTNNNDSKIMAAATTMTSTTTTVVSSSPLRTTNNNASSTSVGMMASQAPAQPFSATLLASAVSPLVGSPAKFKVGIAAAAATDVDASAGTAINVSTSYHPLENIAAYPASDAAEAERIAKFLHSGRNNGASPYPAGDPRVVFPPPTAGSGVDASVILPPTAEEIINQSSYANASAAGGAAAVAVLNSEKKFEQRGGDAAPLQSLGGEGDEEAVAAAVIDTARPKPPSPAAAVNTASGGANTNSGDGYVPRTRSFSRGNLSPTDATEIPNESNSNGKEEEETVGEEEDDDAYKHVTVKPIAVDPDYTPFPLARLAVHRGITIEQDQLNTEGTEERGIVENKYPHFYPDNSRPATAAVLAAIEKEAAEAAAARGRDDSVEPEPVYFISGRNLEEEEAARIAARVASAAAATPLRPASRVGLHETTSPGRIRPKTTPQQHSLNVTTNSSLLMTRPPSSPAAVVAATGATSYASYLMDNLAGGALSPSRLRSAHNDGGNGNAKAFATTPVNSLPTSPIRGVSGGGAMASPVAVGVSVGAIKTSLRVGDLDPSALLSHTANSIHNNASMYTAQTLDEAPIIGTIPQQYVRPRSTAEQAAYDAEMRALRLDSVHSAARAALEAEETDGRGGIVSEEEKLSEVFFVKLSTETASLHRRMNDLERAAFELKQRNLWIAITNAEDTERGSRAAITDYEASDRETVLGAALTQLLLDVENLKPLQRQQQRDEEEAKLQSRWMLDETAQVSKQLLLDYQVWYCLNIDLSISFLLNIRQCERDERKNIARGAVNHQKRMQNAQKMREELAYLNEIKAMEEKEKKREAQELADDTMQSQTVGSSLADARRRRLAEEKAIREKHNEAERRRCEQWEETSRKHLADAEGFAYAINVMKPLNLQKEENEGRKRIVKQDYEINFCRKWYVDLALPMTAMMHAEENIRNFIISEYEKELLLIVMTPEAMQVKLYFVESAALLQKFGVSEWRNANNSDYISQLRNASSSSSPASHSSSGAVAITTPMRPRARDAYLAASNTADRHTAHIQSSDPANDGLASASYDAFNTVSMHPAKYALHKNKSLLLQQQQNASHGTSNSGALSMFGGSNNGLTVTNPAAPLAENEATNTILFGASSSNAAAPFSPIMSNSNANPSAHSASINSKSIAEEEAEERIAIVRFFNKGHQSIELANLQEATRQTLPSGLREQQRRRNMERLGHALE